MRPSPLFRRRKSTHLGKVLMGAFKRQGIFADCWGRQSETNYLEVQFNCPCDPVLEARPDGRRPGIATTGIVVSVRFRVIEKNHAGFASMSARYGMLDRMHRRIAIATGDSTRNRNASLLCWRVMRRFCSSPQIRAREFQTGKARQRPGAVRRQIVPMKTCFGRRPRKAG